MNKILNWTLGSFFRTLGRIIAFFVIGCLIAIILSSNDIKIPRILQNLLLIDKVNAQVIDTYRVWETGNSNRYYYSCDNGNNNTTSAKEIYFSFQYNATVPTGVNRIVIPLSYYMTIMNNAGTNQYNAILNSAMQVQLRTNDGDWAVCGVGDTQLTCSVNEGYTYTGVHFRFVPAFSGMFDCFRVSLNQIINFEYSNDINDIYNNISNVQTSVNDVETAVTNGFNDLNDNINNDDTDEATSEANDFFSSFSTDNHGLTGIITAPLNAIQSLTSASCSNLSLPLPFVNKNLNLPCMRNIYVQYFGGFMQLYDIITLGIVSYWVMVRIFAMVKDFKNPDHDEIEVVDL